MKKIKEEDAIIFVSEFSSCQCLEPKEDFLKLSAEKQEEKLEKIAKEQVMPMLLCKSVAIFKAQQISSVPHPREVFKKMFKERKIARIEKEAKQKIAEIEAR